MKKRIAIDMDEVIADVMPKFEDLYERRFGRRIAKEEYWGKKIYDLPGYERIRDHLYEKGFFADLPVMPDSQEVIKELLEDYDIFVVTAAMEFRNSLEDKYDWLLRHFPFVSWKNFIFCGSKRAIRADYMIDDHARNLEHFKGFPILYTATHNIHETRFLRVNDWQEIRAFFKEEKNKS
jgi:5'(3')-deoxyribonucleotidase